MAGEVGRGPRESLPRCYKTMDQKAWAWACTDLRSFEWSSVVARSGARAAVSRSKVRARQSPAVAFSRSSRSVLGLGATTALTSRRRRVWRQAYGSGRVPGGRDGGRKGMNKGRDRPEACARLRCACGDLSESEPEGEGETSGGGSRSLPRFSKKEDAEGGTSVRVGVVAMGEERNDGTTRKRLRCVYDAWRRTWSQGLLCGCLARWPSTMPRWFVSGGAWYRTLATLRSVPGSGCGTAPGLPTVRAGPLLEPSMRAWLPDAAAAKPHGGKLVIRIDRSCLAWSMHGSHAERT